MEDYEEFLNRLQKRGSKPYKLDHCLGSRDAFHWVRKNKYKALNGKPIDKLLYSQIISEVNKVLIEKMMEGHIIPIPCGMGHLVISRTPAKVEYVDGELKTNYRTDWKRTLQYLYEDEEARNLHKRIMRIQPYIYRVKYYTRRATYTNKRFYLFRANRSLVRKLGAAVEERRIDAEQVEY